MGQPLLEDGRRITNPGDLLRLILVHAAADLPLRQTFALVQQAARGRPGRWRVGRFNRTSMPLLLLDDQTPVDLMT
jgi:hypothetical protein